MYFHGYPCGKKRWRVYDLKMHQIFITRDVFYKTIFSYKNAASSQTPNPNPQSISDDYSHVSPFHVMSTNYDPHPLRLQPPTRQFN